MLAQNVRKENINPYKLQYHMIIVTEINIPRSCFFPRKASLKVSFKFRLGSKCELLTSKNKNRKMNNKTATRVLRHIAIFGNSQIF